LPPVSKFSLQNKCWKKLEETRELIYIWRVAVKLQVGNIHSIGQDDSISIVQLPL